ncbi:MAG: glycosyltransferase [Phycisphaeraceae bacterium]|nr:glycosyltransferase [Phycisphaeraceae bacterium]
MNRTDANAANPAIAAPAATAVGRGPPVPSLVSFIIPAHNEARFLAGTLAAISEAARACGVDFETIVVDDDSTDATASIARSHDATVVGVKLRQIARVRNAGAAAARGGTLVFVDADTRINEAVLRAALAALAGGAVGGGAVVRMDTSLGLAARCFMGAWNLIARFRSIAAGCFVYARREEFEAVGGFAHDLFASEEVEFSAAMRRRGRFVVVPHAVVTSARKLESHSMLEMVGLLGRYMVRGRKMLTTREGLDIWYGERAR